MVKFGFIAFNLKQWYFWRFQKIAAPRCREIVKTYNSELTPKELNKVLSKHRGAAYLYPNTNAGNFAYIRVIWYNGDLKTSKVRIFFHIYSCTNKVSWVYCPIFILCLTCWFCHYFNPYRSWCYFLLRGCLEIPPAKIKAERLNIFSTKVSKICISWWSICDFSAYNKTLSGKILIFPIAILLTGSPGICTMSEKRPWFSV